MLAPVLSSVLILTLIILFISTTTEQRKNLSNIQKITMENARLLSHLASRLATNHAQVYELLKFAADDGDEASLYEMGKPLLNEVHKIEAATQAASQSIESTETVLRALTEYRKKIITAVEMSTVDLALANKFMTLATSEFNKANAALLKQNEGMQHNLKNQIKNFHHAADITLRQYLILFVIVILTTIVISYFLARILSHDLHQSIYTLGQLISNNDISDNSSEVVKLTQVINHVKQNHRNLKKTRNDLEQQESQLRSILDNMIDAVITMDEDGTVLTFNNAAEKIFFYSADEIIGHNINKIIAGKNADKHDGYIKHYLKTGETHIIGVDREVKAKRRNQEIFPIYLSVTELPHKKGNKRCFIASCKDITTSKQQEQQLRRSQKMDALGKLTGGIAHDYNNMLGVILGYSDLLKSSLSDQPEKIDYIDKITHAAERGVKLTSKLMSFSRLKENTAEKVSLNTLIRNQQHMLEKTLTVRIKLLLNLETNLWPIKVDCGDLEDSILNICINAMHAIQNSGQLTIQTQNVSTEKENTAILNLQPGDYIVLSISDNGCGMNEETVSKIFDPFYSTKGSKGTGLGLSQVYGFIKRSNGAVKVYSEVGHGSRFALYFPRLQEDISNTEDKNIKTTVNLKGSENILIVDDEPELLNLCVKILQQHGYKTFKADGASQALKVLEHESIDLLLSDVIMPDIDGFQLADLVQKKYPEIKIQLTSGFSDNRHLNIKDKTLYENLIHKPYSSQILLSKIRELLSE